jgi:hypothetical protein
MVEKQFGGILSEKLCKLSRGRFFGRSMRGTSSRSVFLIGIMMIGSKNSMSRGWGK